VHSLDLAIALDISYDARRREGHADDEDGQEDDDAEKDVASLAGLVASETPRSG
jgi:hypothetical protein